MLAFSILTISESRIFVLRFLNDDAILGGGDLHRLYITSFEVLLI